MPEISVATHRMRKFVFCLLAACLAGACWGILVDPKVQWDFQVLCAAAEAWARGWNPYDNDALGRVLGWQNHMAYVYPPDALPIFRLFNPLPWAVARGVYLGGKLVLAGWVYFIWRRDFLDEEDRNSPWFAAFCLFGLGNTFLIDLRTGNVSLLEQALLWTGLAAYLRGRVSAFCGWLLLAAWFKLTLVALSVLLLLDGPAGRQPLKFALVWGAMAGRLALDALISPTLFHEYVHIASLLASQPEGGLANPASLNFLRDVIRVNLGEDGLSDRPFLLPLLYALVVAGVGVFAWPACQALRRQPAARQREILRVCLVCLTYGLTVPRLKDYSCILLLLPVWVALKSALAGRRETWLAVIVFACLAMHSPFAAVNTVYLFVWHYQVLVAVFVAWACLVWHLRRTPGPGAAGVSSPERSSA